MTRYDTHVSNRTGSGHVKVNRWLATVALLLGIVIMAAVIVGGIALVVKANQVGNALSDIGETSEESPDYYEEPLPYDAPLPEESGCDYEGGPDCGPDGTP